jgi:tetraprenyl-beta-curcumene synthase
MAGSVCNPRALSVAFVGAGRRYWLSVFPHVCREARTWRRRAGEIADPVLRRIAFEAQNAKRDNLLGAAAFAAFVPAAHRASVVRGLTTFQMTLDYLDTLAEQPNDDPIANGRRLHEALDAAVEPASAGRGGEWYAHFGHSDDAGYLNCLVDACKTAIGALPSRAAVAGPLRAAVARVVAYQSLNHGDRDGSYEAFARWAWAETTSSSGLCWWETAAAVGSHLPVFALIAAAAEPDLRPDEAAAIESAYFPWVAALSTLLDSLVDRREDNAEGLPNPIDCYSSPEETASCLRMIAAEALRRTRALAGDRRHTMILAAMASFFHCSRETAAPDVRLATQAAIDAMGGLATPSLLVLRARRGAVRLAESALPRRGEGAGGRASRPEARGPG